LTKEDDDVSEDDSEITAAKILQEDEEKLAYSTQVDVVVHVVDSTYKEHKELDEEITPIEVKTYYNSCNVVIEIKGDGEDVNTASLVARMKKEATLQAAKLNKDSGLSKKVSGQLEEKGLEEELAFPEEWILKPKYDEEPVKERQDTE
jgi:hypothetical protein